MAIFFSRCCKVSFFKVLTLITPCVEVQERKRGAIRKVIVQKEQVELKVSVKENFSTLLDFVFFGFLA